MPPSASLFFRLFRESFLFALQALKVNKLRTFLSLLGITIGIFAIISVFTVTDSLERKIRKDVESLGNNVIYIQKWPWVPEGGDEYPWWKYMNRPLPAIKEMHELQKKTSTGKAMAYVGYLGGQTIKYKSSSVENCQVICASHDYDKIKNFEIEEGRYFSENESNTGKPVALIGADVKDALFQNNKNAIGELLIVRGFKINIIGTLKKEGSSMVDNSSDNCVLIPVNFARSLVNLKSNDVDPFIIVKAKENISNIEMKDELRGNMRAIRKLHPRETDDFTLNETSLLTNSLDSLFGTLSLAGWIIGGFSILVGGFGIANIMFVSVKERTNIIGIQKSLGSKNYFILLQFLVEAVVLCIIGGCIGLTLVLLLSIAASGATGMDLTLTAGNIILGIFISATIGIISGYVPAHQASRMNPVDAIRAN
jgi:putative ABC transport system permease protein